MLNWSQYCVEAATILLALALMSSIFVLAVNRGATRTPELVAAGGGGGSVALAERPQEVAPARGGLAVYGSWLTRLALAFLTTALVLRGIVTGHGPFANQYEFAVAFGWGIVAAFAFFEYRYRVRALGLLVLPVAGGLLLYAMTVGAKADPLVPALQNNLLLTVHVALAIIAYGAFSVACAAGALYLISPPEGRRWLPKPEKLDEIAYRAVVIAFPLMTLVIILGAVWAQIAWGTYWSWDPKETASLFTWLIYGAYLHARVVRGWRGRRANWLLMLGFAAVLFTFFGNLFFGGLHSYSGVAK
ncbi:MAG TPA: c-type cytochrome biogenesis protein CcsB [Kineosporiaceae bacterium]|nr:c-type cytochrome biogenesis protein CcsB [Kineosporiaceae bacterium]